MSEGAIKGLMTFMLMLIAQSTHFFTLSVSQSVSDASHATAWPPVVENTLKVLCQHTRQTGPTLLKRRKLQRKTGLVLRQAS
jgi:hypothetical protein